MAGVYAVLNTPVDAIPDLSENQVDRLHRLDGPQPARDRGPGHLSALASSCRGWPACKAVRSSSEFNFSMITIIFDDNVDFYFARQRVTEKLAQASTFLPPGVVPYLAPDATALGQIFWYTVEGEPANPIDSAGCGRSTSCTSALSSTRSPAWPRWPSVGGTPIEYQIDVDPKRCGPTASRSASSMRPSARATCRPAAA